MKNTVISYKECSGCEACVDKCPKGCIEIKQNDEGFFFPVIDILHCVSCDVCRKVCPQKKTPKFHSEPKEVWIAWALDDKIRKSSSSGGVYSVFANYVLKQGGFANGVKFDSSFLLRQHLWSHPQDIIQSRGSKYVQCCANGIYRKVQSALKSGKTVFFTSTPCQVAGLYAFLEKEYENLFTCDFVCHGVPSPDFFQKYCRDMSTMFDKEIKRVEFRVLNGWGICTQLFFDKKKIMYGKNDYYTTSFLNGLNYRESCYNCYYAKSTRVADITIGDFWGINRKWMIKNNAFSGISLLQVNSAQGQKLFELVRNQLWLERRSIEEAIQGNKQLQSPVARPDMRSFFYKDFQTLSKNDFIAKYKSWATGTSKLKRLIRLPFKYFFMLLRVCINIAIRNAENN